MHEQQKQNKQLFFFIVIFVVFAYLVATVFKVPFEHIVFGAPASEWDYVNNLAVFSEKWMEADYDLPVTVEEAARVFSAIEGHRDHTVYRGIISGSMGTATAYLTREALCKLAAHSLQLTGSTDARNYYIGVENLDIPLDMLAQLGVVHVPFERLFIPDETVNRLEFVQTVARAHWPAFRIINAPVTVNARQKYTYSQMISDLQTLAESYPEWITLTEIGKSVEGRRIVAARLGNGSTEVFLDGSIHAREWVTTPLLMKMLEEYAHHAHHQYLYGGYDVAAMLRQVSFWFIPMLNPDGVTLVLEGPEAVEHEELVRRLLVQSDEKSFNRWKANIRGVDLNRQFPPNWKYLVKVDTKPSAAFFKGYEPLSEPEAQALYDFTLQRNPALVLSYHQRGEILYWYFKQTGTQLARDRQIARALGLVTGYPIYRNLVVNGGKYMDWVISELGVTAIIVEVGTEVGEIREWDRIWRQNRYVGLAAAELILQETP